MRKLFGILVPAAFLILVGCGGGSPDLGLPGGGGLPDLGLPGGGGGTGGLCAIIPCTTDADCSADPIGMILGCATCDTAAQTCQ
jgi:hypothetical protein